MSANEHPAQIRIENVSKVYRSNGLPVRALDGIGLSIESGDFAVLAGPSGSGKSTILHLIGALDRPTEGRVLIDGENLYVRDAEALAAFRLEKVGFVFQAYNLIPVLTARENIEYPLLLLRVPAAERAERSSDLLRSVGLEDQRNKRPGEMSGGQQQRVAVARALAARPKIVLADEPTANLDSKTGSELIDLFRELNEISEVTFLFASHDPNVIGRARHVIRLKDGRVEGEGP
jgi:putative ABC transport system ATP-binding protein